MLPNVLWILTHSRRSKGTHCAFQTGKLEAVTLIIMLYNKRALKVLEEKKLPHPVWEDRGICSPELDFTVVVSYYTGMMYRKHFIVLLQFY